jgi:hypothetical protein
MLTRVISIPREPRGGRNRLWNAALIPPSAPSTTVSLVGVGSATGAFSLATTAPASSSLTLSGNAPATDAFSLTFTAAPSSSLALSGKAPATDAFSLTFAAAPSSSLALSGTAPATDVFALTPAAAGSTLVGLAGIAPATDAFTLATTTPPSSSLTLAGTAPATDAFSLVAAAAGAPLVSLTATATASDALSLTTTAPASSSLAFSGKGGATDAFAVAPSIPGAITITFSAIAPASDAFSLTVSGGVPVSGGFIVPSFNIVWRSASDAIPFRLVSSADNHTPVTGASPTVLISKNAQAFGAPIGTISEIGHGDYVVNPSNIDTNELGPLLLVASAAGADTAVTLVNIVPALGIAPVPVGIPTYPLIFKLGAAGLTPSSVQISKGSGAFATPSGLPINEIGGAGQGQGFYATTPNPGDTNTPGVIQIYATATSAGTQYYGGATHYVTGIPGVTMVLAEAALAIQALIVNSGLFPYPACVISQEEEPFPSPAPPCCWISVGSFRPDEGIAVGSGRYQPVLEGEFIVRVILRRTRDVDAQDTQVLTNASAGGLPIIDNLINVLLEQVLMDNGGNPLVSQTLKLAGIGEGKRYGRDKMMFVIPVRFRARIQLTLQVPDYA